MTTTSDPQLATAPRVTGRLTGTRRAPTLLGGRDARPGPAVTLLLVATDLSPSPTSVPTVPTEAARRSTGRPVPLHAAPTAEPRTSRHDDRRARTAA